MNELKIVGAVVAGLLCVYILARLIFTAYFLTKRQHEEGKKQ